MCSSGVRCLLVVPRRSTRLLLVACHRKEGPEVRRCCFTANSLTPIPQISDVMKDFSEAEVACVSEGC